MQDPTEMFLLCQKLHLITFQSHATSAIVVEGLSTVEIQKKIKLYTSWNEGNNYIP